jgi:hypothetical protein
MTLSDFYGLLTSVGIPVAHYEADLEQYPYIIYQEYATSYLLASNNVYTEKTNVEVIHFTLAEFDETFGSLKAVLLQNGLFFNVATTFDQETKVIQNQLELVLTHDVGDASG